MSAQRRRGEMEEIMKDRVHIYDNPVGVLTNNPPFDKQMFNLNKAPLLQMGGK